MCKKDLDKFSWLLGAGLAFPLTFPSPPNYFFAFLVFFVATALWWRRLVSAGPTLIVSSVLSLVFIMLLSNFLSLISGSEIPDSARIFTTSFVFILFLFGSLVKDPKSLLHGFSSMMTIWAVLILFVAVQKRIDSLGLLLFSVPEYRLWGAEHFPDWPNFLAFLLSLAFLLNALVFKRPSMAVLQILAAIASTSRTPFLAILILFIVMFVRSSLKNRIRTIFSALLLMGVTGFAVIGNDPGGQFMDRLLLYSDRSEIYEFSWNLILNKPFFGHGSILLDDSIGFSGQASFHSTYLDILVRGGVLGLAMFLLLVIPQRKKVITGGFGFVGTAFFFLAGSLFQNFLKHPHIILLYVAVLAASTSFCKND